MTDQYEWTIFDLNQQEIGSGPKSAGDLSPEQAQSAMRQMLNNDVHPATLGVFLLANRWKTNTKEELVAYTETMRKESVQTAEPDADPVDCGANYDGKVKSAVLSVAAGIISAAAGTPIVAHSGDRVPTKHGTTYKHVLDGLGVETDLAPEDSARMVDETGFGFYYQPRFNPGLHSLLDVRNQFGVRTVLNTIETFANPANASVHIGSFYHLPFAQKTIDTLSGSDDQDVRRILMFQGMEGYDDLRPGYTKLAEWTEEEGISDDEIETGEYGMDLENDDLYVDEVDADSVGITERILEGTEDDLFRQATLLNAGLRIYAGGDASSLRSGLQEAEEVLESGAPGQVLSDLRAFEPEASETVKAG